MRAMSTGYENQCRSRRCPRRSHVTPLDGSAQSAGAAIAIALRPFLDRSLVSALGTPTKGNSVFPPADKAFGGGNLI